LFKIAKIYSKEVLINDINGIILMKKTPRETQTLPDDCSRAEPKIFAPPQTPFRGGGAGLAKFNQLPSSTDPVCWRSMHAYFDLSW